MSKNKGFTLIELLIVVAIIAILAAIAIPNFLMAQVRAKVARAKEEMRTIATANEAYYIDNNAYTRYWWGSAFPFNPTSVRFIHLTTPVAYMTSYPNQDPFGQPINAAEGYDNYDYVDEQSIIDLFGGTLTGTAQNLWGGNTWGRAYRVCSAGPDRWQTYAQNYNNNASYPSPGYPNYYDPSNGTVSNGDIIRFGPIGKIGYGGAIEAPIIDN